MFSGAERREVVMKQYQFKMARSIFLVFVALAFFILGLIVAFQPDVPEDVEIPVTLNQAALTGCIMILLSLVLLGFAVFDIAVNNIAINELREKQIQESSSFAKEEEKLALLERYKKLYSDGIITEEEFALKKNAIMREMARK